MFLLLVMIQCHIIDDYYLQGILAELKQKKFWQKNAPQPLYKYDYICALICHAFSWAFIIMLPIAIRAYVCKSALSTSFFAFFAANLLVHACVDNEKANKLRINLCTDQLIHLVQIIITWVCLYWRFYK